MMKKYSIVALFCLLWKIGFGQDLTTRITNVQGSQLGAIDLTMLGGYPPYDFIWTGPNNFRAFTEDISGLQAGRYCVDVSDAHCGTVNWCVTVEECRAAIARLSQGFPCQGQNNGSLTVILNATARQPIRYRWSNGQTTQTATNLAAGSYTVTVTDAIGCIETRSEMLLPQTILIEGTVNHACTAGSATGGVQLQANLIPANRSSMLTFRWSNGSTNQNLTGVGAGTYTVTVASDHICNQTATFGVRNLFTENVSAQVSNKENSSYCDRNSGVCDGKIDLAVRTDRPLNFNWTGPNNRRITGQNINNLCAGNYDVTVSDNNGCQLTLPTTPLCCCETNAARPSALVCPSGAAPTVTLLPQSPDYSHQQTGSIQLDIRGGSSGNYVIRWDGPGVTGSTAQRLTGLGIGLYCVTVKDGCYTTQECVRLVACKEQTITITGNTTPNCDCPTTNPCNIGAIQNVTVTGGSSPYKYQWNTGSRSQNLSSLAAGQYCVTVTTANGCQQTKCFTVDKTPLQERPNESDCSWVDKICPINNRVIQYNTRFVGSLRVQNFNDCKLERQCTDGSRQLIAFGLTRVENFKVVILQGQKACVHETFCSMPDGVGGFSNYVRTRREQAPTTERIFQAAAPCKQKEARIEVYCGNTYMYYYCQQYARRDTTPLVAANTLATSFFPENFGIPITISTTMLDSLQKAELMLKKDSVSVIQLMPIAEMSIEAVKRLQNDTYTIEKVYPNPFQDKILIEMNVWEASDIQMNLVNLLGKSVFEQKQSISRGFNQIVLNIPPLSTGIYNLEVTSKDGTQKKNHKIMRL